MTKISLPTEVLTMFQNERALELKKKKQLNIRNSSNDNVYILTKKKSIKSILSLTSFNLPSWQNYGNLSVLTR